MWPLIIPDDERIPDDFDDLLEYFPNEGRYSGLMLKGKTFKQKDFAIAVEKIMSGIKEAQTQTFILGLDYTEPKWKVLSLLVITAGLRIGEALGIEWRHISFDKHTLSIEQSSQYIEGIGIITKSPKNTSSERLIALPESIIELLKQYREIQNAQRPQLGNKWEGTKNANNDRVFTTWNGQPMHSTSFNTWLKKFCIRNNLPHVTPHSLPNTFGIASAVEFCQFQCL